MARIGSWRFWVIIALALATMACGGRRERREEAREARAARVEQQRLEREGRAEKPPAPRPAQTAAPATPLAPASTAAAAPAAAATDSTIVFIRVFAASGGMINNATASSIFDVTDAGEPKLVGILRGGEKLSHRTKPGQRTFMVVSEAADFMQATIVGGKTYYSLITQRSGLVRARYSFRPVRGRELGGRQFANWDERTRLVGESPEWQAWAKSNAADVADKRARYWSEWSGKPERERAAQTLNAEDGR